MACEYSLFKQPVHLNVEAESTIFRGFYRERAFSPRLGVRICRLNTFFQIVLQFLLRQAAISQLLSRLSRPSDLIRNESWLPGSVPTLQLLLDLQLIS